MSVAISAIGGYIYYFIVREIQEFNLSGGTYIQYLEINYQSFAAFIFYSCCACVLVLVFGFSASQCRKSATAGTYIVIALISGLLMLHSADLASKYENIVDDVCSNAALVGDINSHYQELVNLWMCTPDCKCYSGENGEIKDLWMSYGDPVLSLYKRNAQTKMATVDNKVTYPFKWSDDKENSVSSFKECYDKILKPKRKYAGAFE